MRTLFLSLLFANVLTATEFTDSQNAFTLDLVQALGTPKEANICVSPYNISSALQLAYFGAEGATKQQMASVLHLPMMADSDLAKTIKGCDNSLGRAAINAKALAVDASFLPTDYYLQLVKDELEADAFEVHFKKHPQEACQSINSWASKMTQGRIKELLQPSNITPDTKLVLLSSIYIKSNWVEQFEAHQTSDAPFKTLSGAEKVVPMMRQTKNMRLYQNDAVQVVWKDLEQKNANDARLEVLFVVPKELAKVSLKDMSAWDKEAKMEYVQLFVPKCSVRERFSVKKPLINLGMQLPFSMGADFSALSPKEALMIDDVVHAAFLQLNESGIEAAAATAVIMMTRSAHVATQEPIVVRCDKPFYVVIREKATGLILFVSMIASPEKVEN